MASISYEEIFSNFLGSITDYDLQENLSLSDSNMLMTEYLHKALAEPHVYRLFSTRKLDDNVQLFEYEMATPIEDIDSEFVATALAKWMVYEWLHKQVRSINMTAQLIGTKETKYYSQSQHLSELRALQNDAFAEAKNFILQRGYINNSYLDGGV